MVMFTNNQQNKVQQSATASAPTTVPGTDAMFANVLQVIQGVATQELQGIQAEANRRGGEFEEAILRAQEQLAASSKIIAGRSCKAAGNGLRTRATFAGRS